MMFNGLKWALYVTVCQNECHYLIECKTNHLQRYKISSPPFFYTSFAFRLIHTSQLTFSAFTLSKNTKQLCKTFACKIEQHPLLLLIEGLFQRHLLSLHHSSIFTKIFPFLHSTRNSHCLSLCVLFLCFSKKQKEVYQRCPTLEIIHLPCDTVAHSYRHHHQRHWHHHRISRIKSKPWAQITGLLWLLRPHLLTSQSNLHFISRTLANINDAITGCQFYLLVQCRAPDCYRLHSTCFPLHLCAICI